MTTQVTIKSPKPNHQDVLVKTLTGEGEGSFYSERRLKEGEEACFYVYKGQSLEICEIAKEAQATE